MKRTELNHLNPSAPGRQRRCCDCAGFTLTELAVVIGTVGLLASLLILTVGAAAPNSPAIQCMNNLKQLAVAWEMYAQENSGNLVCNRDGSDAGKSLADAAWVAGWLDYSSGNPDNTNVALLIDHSRYPYGAYLGPYLQTASVFKCPSDKSVVNIGGQLMPRVRSVSMNNYTGQKSRTWVTPSRFLAYGNISQIRSPAGVFVFLDERPDSINDGCFFTNPDTRYNIIDYPAGYHNNAGDFSFADGHAELHQWIDPRTEPFGASLPLPLNVTLTGDVDVDWIQQHASEPK